MARHAVEALLEVAAEPADSTEELLDRLRAAGGALADARPAMGAIAGAVGRVLASAQMAARHMTPDELRRLVTEEGTSLVAGRDRAAASIAVHLAPMLRDALVLTHSASATVREGVVHTPPEVVVCTVSAPFEEGRRMVEELKEAGLRVELVDDDAALTALERSSLLLLGADTVFEDGAVANKIGTRRLAEEATRLGVRTVVACEVLKIAPVAAPTAPDEPESRDVTGSEHVDVVVTEEGPIAGDDLRSLIDRTPFLRDGYRLLRGSG
jgi:translation initiation factor eIF-2B subunit delta/methylthioribose-1-phosphate isomerase